MHKPSNDLIKSLKSSSDEATRKFEQSRHLNEKFLVISFYEGKSYGKLGIVSGTPISYQYQSAANRINTDC
jgi:hypothetical protein